jgi:uncharacterized protein YdaU (DUF1376 family)
MRQFHRSAGEVVLVDRQYRTRPKIRWLKMSLPYMPLYIADYLTATTHLDAALSGAYLHLLMHYWQKGELPKEDKFLARIARMTARQWAASKATIQAFFVDGWKHKRIDAELAIASETHSKRTAAGKAGASARYSNRMAIAEQSNAPSPSPSPSKKKDAAASAADSSERGWPGLA